MAPPTVKYFSEVLNRKYDRKNPNLILIDELYLDSLPLNEFKSGFSEMLKHALISDGKISEISEVLSHPQALAQCSEWLSENLPEAITLATKSTSEAVNMVKGSSFRAAIGSKSLIEIEGLKELELFNDQLGNR